MTSKILSFGAFVTAMLLICACAKQQARVVELKSFPVDNLDGLITLSNVEIDTAISSDGNGSLKISTTEPLTVNLYEVNDTTIENARLVYQAKARCENLAGKAYLEMWCHFPGTGEYFSRSLQSPLSGTMNWTTVETPFFLKSGQKPDLIKLNLVVAGQGDVWIDDIRLLKAPL
jgi:hypothetical protein